MTGKKYLWLIVVVSAIILGAALYSQHVLKMEPCPLCIFQRVAVMAVGLVALVLALVPNKNKGVGMLGAMLVSIPALVGLSIALRQRYIQTLPPSEVPACGPGLDFMLNTLPLQNVIQTVLTGSGECAVVDYVLGVPLPIWSALFFVFVLLTVWWAWFRSRKSR